jgi:putative inorganic carbon (hco3(-)) transporter
MRAQTHIIHHGAYIGVFLAAIIVGLLGLLLVPDPLFLLGVAGVPIAIILAYWLKDFPFELCLMFIVFSFFRIHEAFPILGPFRIPQFLAITTLLSLSWHFLGTRRIQPYWSTELLVFLPFFILCTFGVILATDRAEAWSYWNGTFVKIAVMVFAITWLTREEHHFRRMNFAMVFAGLAVAYVTLYNKQNGIGLVEGTRVTIGRDIGSTLGDPNDLSLILLFPLSFACALLVTKNIGRWQRILGFLATPTLLIAIIATQSRGGLLGLVAVFAIIGRYKIKSNAAIIALCILGAVLLFSFAGISGRSSGGAAEQGIDASADGRLYAWGAAFRMALRFPIFGVGIHNFLLNYYDYSNLHDGLNHEVHSTWFGVMAEAGFVGFFLFITLIGLTIRTAILSARILESRNAPLAIRAFSLASIAGLIGTCVSGSFLTQGFSWPFYIHIAIVVALARYAQSLSVLVPHVLDKRVDNR